MSATSQKKTRSQRVASLEVRPAGWLAKLRRFRRAGGWPRFLLGILGAFAVWGVIQPWQPPFAFRIGQTPARDIRARVDFQVVSEEETRIRQADKERKVPLYFRLKTDGIEQVLDQLMADLQELGPLDPAAQDQPNRIPKSFWPLQEGTGQAIPPDVDFLDKFARFRQALAEPESFESIRETLDYALRPFREKGFLSQEQLETWPPFPHAFQQDEFVVIPPGADPLDREQSPKRNKQDAGLDNGRVLSRRLGDKAEMISTADVLFPYLYRKLLGLAPLTFDQSFTQQQINQARNQVKPRPTTYRVNTPLALAGQPLTEQEVELLQHEHQELLSRRGATDQWIRGAAGFVLVLALYALCGYYVTWHEPALWRPIGSLVNVLVLAVGVVAASIGLGGDEWRAELIPVLLFGMAMAVAYRQEAALLLSVVVCLLVVFGLGLGLSDFLLLVSVVSLGVFTCRRIRSRVKLIFVGSLCGAAAFALTLTLGVLQGQPLPSLIYIGAGYAAWAVASGFLMGGLLPFLEQRFGVVTDISLLELGDVAHPLLQELARRAPGTYNHSINVAAIADAAAESIGGNGLLVRVGAYFHDIGKMLKPDYFIENQDSVNRHDFLMPAMSRLVIIAHVKDGADLGRQYNLPQPIIDFIEQHHGTTLVQYFYDRANRQQQDLAGGTPIEESLFRYPGPKPQTKEAGVLMLADAVESASRTLAEPTATRIKNLVQAIAQARLMDGQFDESGLNLQEIHTIQESLVKSLIAVYHGRVKYSDPKQDLRSEDTPTGRLTDSRQAEAPTQGTLPGLGLAPTPSQTQPETEQSKVEQSKVEQSKLEQSKLSKNGQTQGESEQASNHQQPENAETNANPKKTLSAGANGQQHPQDQPLQEQPSKSQT